EKLTRAACDTAVQRLDRIHRNARELTAPLASAYAAKSRLEGYCVMPRHRASETRCTMRYVGAEIDPWQPCCLGARTNGSARQIMPDIRGNVYERTAPSMRRPAQHSNASSTPSRRAGRPFERTPVPLPELCGRRIGA